MNAYGVRDVERMLGLTRATIRALVDAGFVVPERDARGGLRFSFRDLIVLRTAQSLVQAHIPQRRITRAMRELRKPMPWNNLPTVPKAIADADAALSAGPAKPMVPPPAPPKP